MKLLEGVLLGTPLLEATFWMSMGVGLSLIVVLISELASRIIDEGKKRARQKQKAEEAERVIRSFGA